jgi:hypothetical protein
MQSATACRQIAQTPRPTFGIASLDLDEPPAITALKYYVFDVFQNDRKDIAAQAARENEGKGDVSLISNALPAESVFSQ